MNSYWSRYWSAWSRLKDGTTGLSRARQLMLAKALLRLPVPRGCACQLGHHARVRFLARIGKDKVDFNSVDPLDMQTWVAAKPPLWRRGSP